jgi:hypothetical protein
LRDWFKREGVIRLNVRPGFFKCLGQFWIQNRKNALGSRAKALEAFDVLGLFLDAGEDVLVVGLKGQEVRGGFGRS